jgi:hypothetical protein
LLFMVFLIQGSLLLVEFQALEQPLSVFLAHRLLLSNDAKYDGQYHEYNDS